MALGGKAYPQPIHAGNRGRVGSGGKAFTLPADVHRAVRRHGLVPPGKRKAYRAAVHRLATQAGLAHHIPKGWHPSGRLVQVPVGRTVALAEAEGYTLNLTGASGGEWRHGWIPLNAIAAAIKAKKAMDSMHGGGHGGSAHAPKASAPSEHGSGKAARLRISEATHHNEAGYHITGTDTKGRKVSVFVPGDKSKAIASSHNIMAGKGAFAHRADRSARIAERRANRKDIVAGAYQGHLAKIGRAEQDARTVTDSNARRAMAHEQAARYHSKAKDFTEKMGLHDLTAKHEAKFKEHNAAAVALRNEPKPGGLKANPDGTHSLGGHTVNMHGTVHDPSGKAIGSAIQRSASKWQSKNFHGEHLGWHASRDDAVKSVVEHGSAKPSPIESHSAEERAALVKAGNYSAMSMSDLQHERDHPFNDRRVAAATELKRRDAASKLEGKSASSMSAAEKAKAAEIMHGSKPGSAVAIGKGSGTTTYRLPSGHEVTVQNHSGRVTSGQFKRNAAGKDALDAHPEMFKTVRSGRSAQHDDHHIFTPHVAQAEAKKAEAAKPVRASSIKTPGDARKGDMALVVSQQRNSYIGQPSTVTTNHEFVHVSKVNANGVVTHVRRPGSNAHIPIENVGMRGGDRKVHVLGQDQVDTVRMDKALQEQRPNLGSPEEAKAFAKQFTDTRPERVVAVPKGLEVRKAENGKWDVVHKESGLRTSATTHPTKTSAENAATRMGQIPGADFTQSKEKLMEQFRSSDLGKQVGEIGRQAQLAGGTPAVYRHVAADRQAAVAKAEATGHVGNASMADLAKNRSTAELESIAKRQPNTPEGRAAEAELSQRHQDWVAKQEAKNTANANTPNRLAGRGGDWNALVAMNKQTPEQRARLAANIRTNNETRTAANEAAHPVGSKVSFSGGTPPRDIPAVVVGHSPIGVKIKYTKPDTGAEKTMVIPTDSLKRRG